MALGRRRRAIRPRSRACPASTLSANVYCVGGFGGGGNSHNQVDYAALGASGIGSWSSTTAYPTAIDSASCVNATSGIYCVGGEDGTTVLDDVYFASASSSGLGSWSSEAAYPNSLAAISCVAYSGYVYCVGRVRQQRRRDQLDLLRVDLLRPDFVDGHDPVSPGRRQRRRACVYAGDIYCVAGETENGSNQNSPISDVYYAPLSSSGIGQWTAALVLPHCPGRAGVRLVLRLRLLRRRVRQQPVQQHRHLLRGRLTSAGVTSWNNATPYPLAIDTSACVAYQGLRLLRLGDLGHAEQPGDSGFLLLRRQSRARRRPRRRPSSQSRWQSRSPWRWPPRGRGHRPREREEERASGPRPRCC